MEDLTFGEQVKIILGRKGMTIKQLAELIEVRTGKKMSRQNLTQRLGRDNFQEQDMRMIAGILDCPFHLSIMSEMPAQPRSTAALEKAAIARTEAVEKKQAEEAEQNETVLMSDEVMGQDLTEETAETADEQTVPEDTVTSDERDMTIGELYEIHKELSELEENAKAGEPVEEIKKELEKPKKDRFRTGGIFLRRKRRNEAEESRKEEIWSADREQKADEVRTEEEVQPAEEAYQGELTDEPETLYTAPEQQEFESASDKRDDFEPVITHDDVEEDREAGEINPYTGREYQSNSVRMHPTRIGYVQVYDRTIHKWTDMTEWAFLGLQERKKALLGKAYEPPIYLD